jgi:hypothetical protein
MTRNIALTAAFALCLGSVGAVQAQQDYGQPFVTPPNVPADRVAALREAFVATTRDADFLAEARRIKVDINPVSADELQKLTERLFAMPPRVSGADEIVDEEESINVAYGLGKGRRSA